MRLVRLEKTPVWDLLWKIYLISLVGLVRVHPSPSACIPSSNINGSGLITGLLPPHQTPLLSILFIPINWSHIMIMGMISCEMGLLKDFIRWVASHKSVALPLRVSKVWPDSKTAFLLRQTSMEVPSLPPTNLCRRQLKPGSHWEVWPTPTLFKQHRTTKCENLTGRA